MKSDAAVWLQLPLEHRELALVAEVLLIELEQVRDVARHLRGERLGGGAVESHYRVADEVESVHGDLRIQRADEAEQAVDSLVLQTFRPERPEAEARLVGVQVEWVGECRTIYEHAHRRRLAVRLAAD